MPYTKDKATLPANVQKAPKAQRDQWVEVWNRSYAAAKKDGKSDQEAEQIAFRTANGVLKQHHSAETGGPMGLLTRFARSYRTEDGAQYPAEAFAYVPDPAKPSSWRIRLWESPSAKETAAQIGRAAAALSEGGFRGNPAEIPAKDLPAVRRKVRAAWKRQNPGKKDSEMPKGIQMAVDFAIEDAAAGVVRRWGKLFHVGDYPDKGFSVTPAELAAAAEQFVPCPLDMQHVPTVLDGKLGMLDEVELSEDGTELYGWASIPLWFEQVNEGAPITVSTTWTPDTKRITKLAIVREPRVEDAVLLAAFAAAQDAPPPLPAQVSFEDVRDGCAAGDYRALLVALRAADDNRVAADALIELAKRHDTREGQSTIQSIHDTAARYGAVCVDPSAAEMASAHEAQAMQAIHDLTVEHGAACSDASKPPSWYFAGPTTAAAAPPEEEQMSKFEEWFRKSFGLGADWQPPTEEPAAPSNPAPQTPAPPTTLSSDPELQRLRDENRRAKEENERLQSKLITDRATKFADDLIVGGKALPAEKAAIVAAFSQAAFDDLRGGLVHMADGQDVSRVSLIEAQYACRPDHQLDLERLPSDMHKVLTAFSKTPEARKQDEGTDRDSIDRLIGLTAAGAEYQRGNGQKN